MGKVLKSVIGVVAAVAQTVGLVDTPKAPKAQAPAPAPAPAPVAQQTNQDTGGGGGGGGGGNSSPAPAPAPAPAPVPLLDNPAKVADTGALQSTTKQAAQAGGPADTMLTGTVGVDPASLTLGKNTLLGG